MSTIVAFLCFSKMFPGPSFDYYRKINFYQLYVNPIMSYAYLILCSLFIITTTVAFVFVPKITDLFDKKFIKSMRIVLFFISLFFVIWYIFYIYQNSIVDFNRVLITDVGLDIGIIILAILNMFAEYIPRTLFASAMWFLSSTPKGTENNEETVTQEELVLSHSLADENDDEKYLFPT